ncbi:MAG TPA: hypothetical protein VGE16_03960 [Albitalea sp.]
MAPIPIPSPGSSGPSNTLLHRLLAGMSFFTLAMTLPQVFNVWVLRQASGVSVLSWSAYLLSAVLWFWYGLRQRDRNIYLPCVGWMILDAAVISGVLVHG